MAGDRSDLKCWHSNTYSKFFYLQYLVREKSISMSRLMGQKGKILPKNPECIIRAFKYRRRK